MTMKIKVYKCSICGYFYTKAHLQRHLLRHRETFPKLAKELKRLEEKIFREVA